MAIAQEDPASRPLVVEPVSQLEGMVPYTSSARAERVDLLLDRNESDAEPVDPHLDPPAVPRNRYRSAAELERLIAALHGAAPASVLVTAGADEALERVIRSVCGAGRKLLMTAPSFAMLARFARLAGAEAGEVEWWSGSFPVAELVDRADDATSAVAVVSPNNPTGATISADELAQLAAALPRALVLLDHAYVEFAAEELTSTALALPNVVVFRTFSKAWGCAGLRVGYALGDPRVITWARCLGQPFPVSSASLEVVERLVRSRGCPEPAVVAAVRRHRHRLIELLSALGCDPLPSEANFVLARFPDAGRVRIGLGALGVAVRAFPDPRLADHLRITVPASAASYERLAGALRSVCAVEADIPEVEAAP